MTITVIAPDNVKATGFDVYYKMKTSFVNLFTNGNNQMNFVAFEVFTSGEPAARYRNVTIWARVQVSAGPNSPVRLPFLSVYPLVIPLSTAQ